MIEELKAFVVNALVKQAYLALVAIPGFGWVFGLPVISHLVNFILVRCIAWQVQQTAVGLSILWIMVDLQYGVQYATDAKKKLEDMINNPTKYSEEQQKEIMEYFDETTVALIQLELKRLA